MDKKKIAVIGGGASGMAASVKASSNGHDVSIFEHNDSLGKKLLITGNGKCNFTNLKTDINRYHSETDDGLAQNVLSAFGVSQTLDFFSDLGLYYKVKKDGGVYPYTDTAKTVLSMLKCRMKSLGINTFYKQNIRKIPDDNVINGEKYDVIIIATGGKSAKNTGSDGSGFEILKNLKCDLIVPYPALAPVPVEEDLKTLKGVRCQAKLTLYINDEYAGDSLGELQPYETGLSGICAMDLSGRAARALINRKKAVIECDFFPYVDDEGFLEHIRLMSGKHPDMQMKDILMGMLNEKLVNCLFSPLDTRKKDFLQDLLMTVKHHRFHVSQKITADFEKAQVTGGGLSLSELNPDLSLKRRPDIRVCGEVLDIYGDCGGFNLQWAISSGMIAGDIK